MRSNRFSLMLMVAMLVTVAGISSAFNGPADDTKPPPAENKDQNKDAQTAPPKEPPKEGAKPANPPPDLTEDRRAADQMNNEKTEGKATERFTPSDRTSADNSATFPVDI